MPTVYVVCYDSNSPSGGIMKLYDFVDVLNANGIESYIIHNDKNFKVDWFKNTTKVTSFDTAAIKSEDLLIIPEGAVAAFTLKYFPGIKKIILNQNSFYTFNFYGDLNDTVNIYLHQDILQVVVVSEYDDNFFKWFIPKAKVSRITYGINNKLFYYSQNKKKQIAVMTRKSAEDFSFLNRLLSLRGNLQEYSIKIIDNIPLENVAEILRESEIFLSFSYKESFGLPPAEAMACGCIVIGYHGQGGKEFFKEGLTYPIEQSNLIAYAKCVKEVIEEFRINPLKMQEIGRQASQFILDKYSLANQEKSVLAIFKQLIN